LELNKEVDSQDEEAKTIELVNKRFKEAAKYREEFEKEWKECEDFYAGIHWKDKNRSFKNLVFPLVEQEIAILTDSIPSTDVLARKEEREQDAKTLEESIHFTYEQQSLFLKLSMAMRSALKIGTGYHYVDFDPDADHGQGITTIKTVPWEHVYFDPACTDIDEASFVGIKFPVRVAEAKRRFPKIADKLKPEGKEEGGFFSKMFDGAKEARANYSTDGKDNSEKFKLDDMVTIKEAWLRDHDMVDIPEEETITEIEKETEQFFNGINPDIGRFEDHEKHLAAHSAQRIHIAAEALGMAPEMVTDADIENLKQDPQLGLILAMIEDHNRIHEQYKETNPENKKPKYNEALRLVILVNNVIAYDGSAPVDDGMVPLVPYYCYKDEKSIYGTGEVKNILPSQKSFNEMDNAEYESLHLTSNPGWVMSNDAGIDPSSVSNKRGKVYVVNKGADFRRLEPGQTSPQLIERKHSDQQYMEIISGMNEASQGRRPGGVTAAKAIERLQQQTNGRIRLKSSTLTLYSLPRLGKLVASRNAKYWTTERLMRITDNTSGEVKLVKFDPEQVKDLEYDVRVVPGSLAGVDKESIAEAMSAFVDKGWLPPKVFFQCIDVPNKKKILEALDQNDQQRMMLEQLSQQNQQLMLQIQQLTGQAPEQQTNEAPAEQSIPAQMAPQT
jgi:hypothetical protein